MHEFRQKQIVRRRIYSKPVIFLLIIILALILNGTWKVYEKSKQSEEKLLVSKSKLEDIEGKKDDLESNINRLDTPSGVEEEIRSKFDVGKNGEAAVVIVHKEDKVVPITKEKGFWAKMLERIKNIF